MRKKNIIIMADMIPRMVRSKINQTFSKEIKDELVKKDPKHKDDYEKNYKN